MAQKRLAMRAVLILMAASFLTVRSEAGPLLDMFSHSHEVPYYSPLHYWLPGIWEVRAGLQPLPPDSPEVRHFHLRNRRGGNSGGDGSESTTPVAPMNVQEMPRVVDDGVPIAPR